MTKTVLGQKMKIGKKLVAPNNKAVLAYLDSAQKGKGLADKVLSRLKKRKIVLQK